jgi:hypothetical protein
MTLEMLVLTCDRHTKCGGVRPVNGILADLIIVVIASWIYQFDKEISKYV